MHRVHTGRWPAYLSSSVKLTSDLASRLALRSASSRRYEDPLTALMFDEREFSFARPCAWNSLPADLQEQSNAKTLKQTVKNVLIPFSTFIDFILISQFLGNFILIMQCAAGQYCC